MLESFEPGFQTDWFATHGTELLKMHADNEDARMKIIETLQDIVREYLDESAVSQSTGRILEIGCGTGFFRGFLAPDWLKSRLISIDINKESLEVARASQPDGEFMRQDANNLAFGTEVFDAVIGYSSLDSMPDLPRVLTELKHVVKKGKPILLWQDCCVDLYNPFGLLQDSVAVERYHSALVQACQEVGMTVISEGTTECVCEIPKEDFIQRIDRKSPQSSRPEEIRIIAFDRGSSYALKDIKQCDDFIKFLNPSVDIAKHVSLDGVVQWARIHVVHCVT